MKSSYRVMILASWHNFVCKS